MKNTNQWIIKLLHHQKKITTPIACFTWTTSKKKKSFFHLPLNIPLNTWLFPPSDASHSTEDIAIWVSVTTISRISGLLTGSSLKHHRASSAIYHSRIFIKWQTNKLISYTKSSVRTVCPSIYFENVIKTVASRIRFVEPSPRIKLNKNDLNLTMNNFNSFPFYIHS